MHTHRRILEARVFAWLPVHVAHLCSTRVLFPFEEYQALVDPVGKTSYNLVHQQIRAANRIFIAARSHDRTRAMCPTTYIYIYTCTWKGEQNPVLRFDNATGAFHSSSSLPFLLLSDHLLLFLSPFLVLEIA